MIRCLLTTLLLSLTLTAPGWTGELGLVPQQVADGEVAVLHWRGEPLSFGVLRFNDRVISFFPDRQGAMALVPVPLGLAAGDYPLLVALADRHGVTTARELVLRVYGKPRPVEHLTLPERMVTPRAAEDLQRIEREGARLQQLFSGRTPRLWDDFQLPVDAPVSSVFGKGRLLNGQPRAAHSGTDFRSPAGTLVRAIAAGRVVLVDDLFYTGQTVVLDHGEGLFSLYAHLSSSSVVADRVVGAGEPLGRVGSTGRSTGPHLHLTVRLLGERIDPVALIDLFVE